MKTTLRALLGAVLVTTLSPLAFAEDDAAALIFKLPSGWHVLSRNQLRDHEEVTYVRQGESRFAYSGLITQEVRNKTPGVTFAKVKAESVKEYGRDGCKTATLSRSADGKRSMFRFSCVKGRRSGVHLTVEGDNNVIYSIQYQVAKPALNAEEEGKLVSFLDSTAKICKRSDRNACVR